MRWSPAEIRSSTQVLSPSAERINVWSVVINKEAGLPLTEGELGTTITVAQLGRTGGGGIWSVTDVRSSVLTFRVGPQGRNGCPVARLAGGKPAGMCGRVAPLFPTLNPRRVAPAGANFVAWKVYVGPNADIVQGEGNLLGGGFDVVQGRFGGGLTENFPRNATVLLVELLHQPGGKVVGAEALRLNLRRG
jgi:hypothetical protein